MIFVFQEFSGHSNPPDELAQNVSKKNPFRTNYSSIFLLRKFRIWPFFQLFTGFEFDFFGPQELIQKYFRRARTTLIQMALRTQLTCESELVCNQTVAETSFAVPEFFVPSLL